MKFKAFVGLVFFFNAVMAQNAFSLSQERLKDNQTALEQIPLLSQQSASIALKAVATAPKTIGDFTESSGSLFENLNNLHSSWRWYPRAYGYQRLMGHSQISWGFLPIEGFNILTIKMTPLVPSRKLVVFMHGYLDHSGNYTNFYDELVRQGISVVTFDMPGHGLSDGPRASIPSFEVYAQILAQLSKKFASDYDEVVLAGFSTGGSAILEVRRLGLLSPTVRAVMVAPLFRIKHYWIAEPAFLEALNLKYTWGWTFLDAVLSPSRKPTVITHDELFKKILSNDPLSPEIIPEAWTLSYITYADRIEQWSDSLTAQQRSSFGDVLVLQGDDDNVVDAEQGTDFMARTFTHADIQWIPEGRHALLNEGLAGDRDILPEVYSRIVDFIKQ